MDQEYLSYIGGSLMVAHIFLCQILRVIVQWKSSLAMQKEGEGGDAFEFLEFPRRRFKVNQESQRRPLGVHFHYFSERSLNRDFTPSILLTIFAAL